MEWIRLKLAEAIGGKQPINKKLLLLMAGVVAVVVFLINGLTNSEPSKVELSSALPADQITGQQSPGHQSSVQQAVIYVHVVGEVISPGIYQLDSGSRLMDAVFAAGGLTKLADDASVNLARELTDGEQIVIFKVGEAPQIISSANSPGALISLNRASAIELEALPGVGPALAGRIIDWRTANGGFKKKEDLLSISGIGDKLFAGLKDQVAL